MSWKSIVRIAIVILVLVLVLLFVRQEVEAQENSLVISVGQSIEESTRRLGFDSSVAVLGRVSETKITKEDLVNPQQAFYLSSGDGTQAFTIEEFATALSEKYQVPAEQLINDMLSIVEANTDDLLSDRNWVLEVNIDGKQSFVVVHENGSEFAGALSVLTRSYGFALAPGYRSDLRDGRREDCTYKELSKDFLGRTAEWANVCTSATCQSGSPQNCSIEKTSGSKPFGSVEFIPPDRTEAGQVFDQLCVGKGHYNWRLSFLGITWGGDEYSVPGLTFSKSGALASNTVCF